MARSDHPLQRVLVIEDGDQDGCVCASLSLDRSLRCERASWHSVEPAVLEDPSLALILAVILGPHERVAAFVDAIRHGALAMPLVVVVPEGADDLCNLAMGIADDFLFAPIRPLELRHRVARMLGAPRQDLDEVCERVLEDVGMGKLVGRNPRFVRAIRLVPRFAKANATVLITGETGTGKEVCARALHHLSSRRHAPFVPVDCGALPDQLFENELFGHARGAFTDAHRDQKGLVALAEGGTLFLDEIDSLSLPAQAKLLRFLQDGTYRPLGSERNERANVRVVAACNGDLDARVRGNTFRADLFFRLNILRLSLPPLRDRRDDIPLLAQALVDELRSGEGSQVRRLSAAALRTLTAYDWPGNIRELANVVHRAVLDCDGDTIQPEHLDLPEAARPAPLHFRAARAAAVATFERAYVEELLRKHDGNVTHAAREAHQDRRAFGRAIKKYKIDRGSL